MPEVRVDSDGWLALPAELAAWLNVADGEHVIVERHGEELTLHPARPDARSAYIEVTTRCNLDCAICIRQVAADAQGEMDWETFRAIIAGLGAFSDLQKVTLGGLGEPLLHPRLPDMLRLAAGLGRNLVLTTNGLLLDDTLIRLLLDVRLHTLVVSLDTVHIQAYERAVLPDGLEQVLSNLRRLRRMGQAHGWQPRLGLEFVLTRSNAHWLDKIPILARDVGASFALVSNLLPYLPEAAAEVFYDRPDPLPTPGGWALPVGDFLLWGVVQTPRVKWGAQRQCRFVQSKALVVGWDGGVSPCYALLRSYPYYIYGRQKRVTRYVLGNVRERSLGDIWTSEEYVRFRARVRDFRFPSCVDCGMACTYAEENEDCWGNAPSCADCLYAQDIIRCP